MAAKPETVPVESDLYSSRAKEYLDRYEAMRGLEWRIVFEIYAGYAGIAAAFAYLNNSVSYASFRVIAMGSTLAFFAAIQYVYYRIQERLIVFNESHEACMRMARPLAARSPKTTDAALRVCLVRKLRIELK